MVNTQPHKRWTTRQLLAWMGKAFEDKGLDAPKLSAEMLVAHVIGCDRLKLYMDPDRPASPLERDQLRDLTTRALKHEPVQYLTGEARFYGLTFHVDRRVLIPRPATETIVQTILEHVRMNPAFAHEKGEGVMIADVCTGSGCIAIALLKRLPKARAVATDISADALEVAKDNARRHEVLDRLDFRRGNLVEALLDHPITRARGSVHYLASNPPYIPDEEWVKVEPNVKDHEPTNALRGGESGLDLVTPVIDDGCELVKKGGLMLVEVATSRAKQAAELMEARPEVSATRVLKDVDNLPRVIEGTIG